MQLLNDLQPYLSALGALLGITTLGFVIRLAAVIQNAERARAAVVEERLKLSQDHLTFSETRSKRIAEDLTAENERLRTELKTILDSHGLTPERIEVGASLKDVADVVSDAVRDLLSQMEQAEASGGPIQNADWHLERARGYSASHEWSLAAQHYDIYVGYQPDDYMSQHSRGVAHANSRLGRTSSLAALRAYNEAIAFMPEELSPDTQARFYAHRGGMLKRLGRLLESESDLLVAKQLTTKKDYVYFDLRYNLACVFAMRGERQKLFEIVDELEGRRRELSLIRSHLDDYFIRFCEDTAFLDKIG